MRYSLLILSAIAALYGQPPKKLLFRNPALTSTHIVFVHAGDLWTVPRQGGEATRLTTGVGSEGYPVVSPDGKLVAFEGDYDGNIDVFTVPISGGVPKRITWHPRPDTPLAFTPDGTRILFRSNRESISNESRLFTVSKDGGMPVSIPLPSGEWASYSPDGKRLAYVPNAPWFTIWKKYRGGGTTPIWLADLSDSKIEKLPRENSNDFNPIWIGDKVYFLSDRKGPFSLWSYDLKSRKVIQAADNTGLDFKSASAGPGAIVIEQFGAILLHDLKSGTTKPVNITLSGDMAAVRPYWDKVAGKIQSAAISPTGARVAFNARGEILTAPAEKGDIRNLTNSSGVAERWPSWSPDGRSIAYFSDESGDYQLHVAPQNGAGEVKKFNLGPSQAFYWGPRWSPDSKMILWRDSNLAISMIDLATGKIAKVDTDTYDAPQRADINPSWSPDSKWIVYTKLLKNHLRAVHVYSLDTSKITQLSDGMSDAQHAAFDKEGKYLYFTASTNQGLAPSWLDMSSLERVTTRSVYLVVLRKEDASPIAPESDEEKAEEPKKTEPAKPDEARKAPETKIDFEGIDQRILALPIRAADYSSLAVGKTGIIYLLENAQIETAAVQSSRTLHKFDLKTRKFEKVMDGVGSVQISANGEKMLYSQGPRWAIAGTTAPPRPGEGTIKTDSMEVYVDPLAEWKQMYREVWRIERDFFYDPGLHGMNLANMKDKYAAWLDGIASRADLNYLFAEMLGELSAGHTFVSGGAITRVKGVPGGLLGADYEIENGRYRFKRIYSGENWNPQMRAPLTQPGINVKAGEYLLAVNGKDVQARDEVFSYFESLSGKNTVVKVGPNPDGSGSRDVTVIPIADEGQLRHLAWIESNRRTVDQLSGGKAGYVYLPNTSVQGYANFNRYYFAQVGKQSVVLDERFNSGGFVADYIIDSLRRPLLNYFATRAGEPFTTPMGGIFGPKVMVVNERAFSGGDAMPWIFKELKIGQLVGKRTGGGLIGNTGFVPQLIDGGSVTAPNLAFYNLRGQWDVENNGVQPDIEVDMDPAIWRQGRDPQLERAVAVLMDQLKKNPTPVYSKPEFPNHHAPKPAPTRNGK